MFSVIMCCRDDARFATADAHYRAMFAGTQFEIIRIADAKSMCEGYNRGIAQSRGDVLIFSHDDMQLHATKMPARIERRLAQFDLIGVAGTTDLIAPRWSYGGPPYAIGQIAHLDPNGRGFMTMIWNAPSRAVGGIQALDGLWMCGKRSLVEQIGFDAATFSAFHLYDLDFSYRAFRAGFKLGVCTDFYPLHQSFGKTADDPGWQREAAIFMQRHQLAPTHRVPIQSAYAWSLVPTLDEAMATMKPPWWPADEV